MVVVAVLVLGTQLVGPSGAGGPGKSAKSEVAKMTAGARVSGGGNVTISGKLHCDPDDGANSLQVKWDRGNRFHLEQLVEASCDDEPTSDPGEPEANFDLLEGQAMGRYNRERGATAAVVLVDAGEPGRDDRAEIQVRDSDGRVVLDVAGVLRSGNNQAHGQAQIMPREDPENVVHSVEIGEDGTLGRHSTRPLSEDAFTSTPPESDPKEDQDVEQAPDDKIHPILDRRLAEEDPETRVEVLVNLRDEITVPRFPDLPNGVSRDSELGRELSKRQDAIIQDLLKQRRDSTEEFLGSFDDSEQVCKPGQEFCEPQEPLSVQVMEQFWLINGFHADASLRDVRRMSGSEEVLYIEPRDLEVPPPNHDGNANNDVDDGRRLIVSDPYFNLPSMTGSYIGLLDTGVRDTHTLFNDPDHIDFQGDCTAGGTTCLDSSLPGFSLTDCWNHGTSTAAIITGNGDLGNAHRGVTAVTLDSWKVYPGCGGLDGTAAVLGFQQGLAVFDRIFVGEMQPKEADDGAIATAADNAFDAGALTISANGNFASSGDVRSPAIAHKVIGVGAYDVNDGNTATLGFVSRGPANDGRYKPDIEAPTRTETASATSDTALKSSFGGTSGATPYGAGAGTLMRNWLRKFNTFDPGQSYSRLIISGQRPWCCYDNNEGAGDLQLPVCGVAYWGKVSINSTGSTVNIPIGVGSGKRDLQGALWWPEAADESHDDLDIFLIDPHGVERSRGYSYVSVFERAQVDGPLTPGTWTVRVKGWSVSSGPQSVYWTADVHGC